ncbi:hypothetical protein TBLA_0G00290 [Henningerozyma blattae CBS 6284]|uniref:UBZ4-type domain-containing protein n=1 Tax=Henningerozyma blattae (strain ATCC 34711 / CBS 6284 / DSM 70876 / NBRC 10599 / NRRL Y-10934 / UCD 77-7) TaxID=1071380 RepID=I2H6H6_HENB6|nr:hypothetical protein TBLA_0G00290 [Tetrapisispora blattae CBS 6284]CCH61978.1 hypothetical protein TBLA_0G00290 [Tetrapisispora blattae CBS 6284]
MSKPKKNTIEQQISCPICKRKVSFFSINDHLDTCTKKSLSISPISSTQSTITSMFNKNSKRNREEVIDLDDDNQSELEQTNKLNTSLKSSKDKDNDIEIIKREPLNSHSVLKSENTSFKPATINTNTYTNTNTNDYELRYLQKISHLPLSEKIRPHELRDYVGQQHILSRDNGTLYKYIQQGAIPSMILWGPPGVGKTSLARLMVKTATEKSENNIKYQLIETSATKANTQELRGIFEKSKKEFKLTRRIVVLFIDEIHRFNKAQQDLLLPHVENGDIILIGATTENPSFQLNNALISRCHIFVLEKLSVNEICIVLSRGIAMLNKLRSKIWKFPTPLKLKREILEYIVNLSIGDTRRALNLLEMVEIATRDEKFIENFNKDNNKEVTDSKIKEETKSEEKAKSEDEVKSDEETNEENKDIIKVEEVDHEKIAPKMFTDNEITIEMIKNIIKRNNTSDFGLTTYYDTKSDNHYDTISAFHKAIRGSDDNASLYYLGRMLQGGEDPLYIARRMIRIASEDIGIIDNSLLTLAISTHDTVMKIGMPEADMALVHCCVALARSPKSVEIYRGWNKLKELLNENLYSMSSSEIPMHIRNAPTELMKDLGYHKGYKYNPNYKDGLVKQEYFPQEVLDLIPNRDVLKFLNGKHLGDKVDPDLQQNGYS